MPKQPRKCKTRFCRGRPQPGRRRCDRCRKRIWRKNNPIRTRYIDRKSQAKRRGIPFDLTMDYFTDLCLESGYHKKSGRTAGSLSVDRIENDHNIGYVPGNVQVITVSQNSLKWHWRDNRRPEPEQ